MRGRKGKYYSQVDDEDQTFLEQERRLVGGKGGDDFDEDDEERRLDMIEEESQNSTQRKLGEDDTNLMSKSGNKKPLPPNAAKPGDKLKAGAKGSNVTSPRDPKQLKALAIPEEAEEHEDDQIAKGAKKGAKKGGPRGKESGADAKGPAKQSPRTTKKDEPVR